VLLGTSSPFWVKDGEGFDWGCNGRRWLDFEYIIKILKIEPKRIS
jgi:hypothetical protein